MKKFSIKRLLEENINEWDDENEGPQPGDVDYHYKQPTPIHGVGKFNNIDWHALWDTLMANQEYRTTGKIDGNPSYIRFSVNDFTDYEEGLLTQEELDKLEYFDLINIFGPFPEIGDEKYFDYDTFKDAALSIWDKEIKSYNDNSSESPYLRGREDVQEQELDYPIEDELTDVSGDGTSDGAILSKLEKQGDFIFKEMKDKTQKTFSTIDEARKFILNMDDNSTESYDFIFSIEDPNSEYDFIFELKADYQKENPYYSMKSWSYHTEYDGSENEYVFFGEDSSSGSNSIYDVLDLMTDIQNNSTKKTKEIQENNEDMNKENPNWILNNKLVRDLLKDAGLESFIEHSADSLEYDVAEALYVFRLDYNEDSPFYHSINNLLNKVTFKPSPMLHDYNNLSEEGKVLYDELENNLKFYESQVFEESKTPEEKEQIKKDNREKFTDRMMKSSVMMQENDDENHKYENVVFMQGSDADEALRMLDTEGAEIVMDYLKQWHQPGEHEVISGVGNGTLDKTYRSGNYVMSYNMPLGYIGLSYKLDEEAGLNEDTFKEETFFDKNQPSKKLRDLIDRIEAWYEENNPDSLDNVEKKLEKILNNKEDGNEEKIQHLKTRYKNTLSGKPVLEEEDGE